MAELADALDLGSSPLWDEGSTPSPRRELKRIFGGIREWEKWRSLF